MPNGQGRSYEYNSALPIFEELTNVFDDAPYQQKEIARYMRNPQLYNKRLRKLANWAARVNGSVAAAVNYACSMHTLDYVAVCKATRKSGKSRYPRNYKTNSSMLDQTFAAIRYKDIYRDMLRKCCLDGSYFYYMEVVAPEPNQKRRMTDYDVSCVTEINSNRSGVSVIPLPIDYCRIVGREDNSYVVAFDLTYFEKRDVNERTRLLRGMPAEIRDAWGSYSQNHQEGNWVVLDNAHTIAGKVCAGINEPWGVPLVMAALDDVFYARHFVSAKRGILDRINHQIIYQTFPEGAQKGMSALTEEQQRVQHQKVKDAVLVAQNRQGVSFFSLPGGTKIDQLEVNSAIFDDDTENMVRDNVAVDIGIAPSVMTGNSSGNYATSTLNIDLFASFVYSWIESFTQEMNKAFNACALKDSSCPVDAYILPTTFANRDKFVEQTGRLYTEGKGSLTAWIASVGINPQAYLSLMEYELSEDFENRYPVHATSYTHTSDTEGGRPENDSPTSSSTLSTKANASNAAPKPSV